MDKIDKKIVTLLQKNARTPLKALAEKVMATELLRQNHTHASLKAASVLVLVVLTVAVLKVLVQHSVQMHHAAIHNVLTLVKNSAIHAHAQLVIVQHALAVTQRHVVHVASLNGNHAYRS